MEGTIREQLRRLEREEGLRVLLAVESGSRAWGFASPDSDWDVRFVYARRRDDYLTVEPIRDVIEEALPGDLDLVGWDLRKTLGLLRKSNPTLCEHLVNPHVYVADEAFRAEMRALAAEFFDPDRLRAHYASMALSNRRAHFEGETVRLKKYVYVLRAYLCAEWVRRRGETPPIPFDEVVGGSDLPPGVAGVVAELLARKRAGIESEAVPPWEPLHSWLTEGTDALAEWTPQSRPLPPAGPLDAFFRRWIA